MKLLRVTTLYPTYWKRFYAKHPDLATQTYQNQKQRLDFDGFGWADFWSHALTSIGYEVMEINTNVKPLQKAWAIEQGIQLSPQNWLLEILSAQIQYFQPDILFLDDYTITPNQWLSELRNSCPSIRLIISWCGSPYRDSTVFKVHDLVLSCIPEFVELFRGMGYQSEHLNHAFDPRICERLQPIHEPVIDLSFVGQVVRGNQYHSQREQMLEGLVDYLPLQIYSPSASLTRKEQLKAEIKSNLYTFLQKLHAAGIPKSWLTFLPQANSLLALSYRPLSPINPKLQQFIRSPVFGLEMFQTLKNSKITFNCHIDVSPRSASNMRMFEATGVSTCLVTDWKENIQTLFEPDYEVVTYKSLAECVEKIQWLLMHPEQRQAIAQAAQQRVFNQHTFKQRAHQLNDIITKVLRQK